MDINMEDQFQKLQEIVLNKVDKFYFFAGAHEYLGPVQPTALISFNLDFDRMNALVLAEAVPAMYFPPKYTSILYDAVIVLLDKDFEFKSHDSAGRGLYELNLLIGDPKYSYDGTVDGAKAFFEKYNSVLEILYRKDSTNN